MPFHQPAQAPTDRDNRPPPLATNNTRQCSSRREENKPAAAQSEWQPRNPDAHSKLFPEGDTATSPRL
ncbi:MAG TPA: hypothetical protein VK956_16170, partial [Verrucomicrobium sp.]|nr:hypothetical protein [Verrucomicrobium sp.]